MVESFNDTTDREPSEQVAGRFVGLVVFLVGIAILILTFALTYQAFQNTDTILPLKEITGPGTSPPTTTIVVRVVLRFLLLIAMGYIGSLIAARGAQFFFSARREVRRATAGD